MIPGRSLRHDVSAIEPDAVDEVSPVCAVQVDLAKLAQATRGSYRVLGLGTASLISSEVR